MGLHLLTHNAEHLIFVNTGFYEQQHHSIAPETQPSTFHQSFSGSKATQCGMQFSKPASATTASCSSTVNQKKAVLELETVKAKTDGLCEQFKTIEEHAKACFLEKKAEHQYKFQERLTTLPLFKQYEHTFLKVERDFILKADVEEIFEILEPHWNHVDYSLLECSINEFGTNELQEEMKKYIADLEHFEKKTTIQDYNLASLAQTSFPKHFVSVTITQDKDSAKCTLHEVRQFRNDIVNQSTINDYALLTTTSRSKSAEIVVAFPPDAITEMQEAFDVHFKMKHKIISVKFNQSLLRDLGTVVQRMACGRKRWKWGMYMHVHG